MLGFILGYGPVAQTRFLLFILVLNLRIYLIVLRFPLPHTNQQVKFKLNLAIRKLANDSLKSQRYVDEEITIYLL